jgi:small subunit ribosomal protein S13
LVLSARLDIGTLLTLFEFSFSLPSILEVKEFSFYFTLLVKLMALVLYGRPLPSNKTILYALPLLFGLGLSRSREICRALGFPSALRVAELTPVQEAALAQLLKEHYTVAGKLEEQQKLDIQRYRANGSQRGYRLRTGLPVRGQRTHSNGKTARRLRSFGSSSGR